MNNSRKAEGDTVSRRDALRRLGLAAGAAYIAPAVLMLSKSYADDGSDGGASGGGASGGDDSGGDDSGGDSGGANGGGPSGGGNEIESGGASSVGETRRNTGTAGSPSSSAESGDGFSGDPTPAARDLSPEEELRLIQNGWQKAGD